MIELKNVSKHYQHADNRLPALQDINLCVKPNEIVGVIGKSGAGKSTLIRCVNLLEKPDTGEVWVNHQNLTALDRHELPKAREKIGMIFQHFNLLDSQNIFNNIALPLKLDNKTGEYIQTTVTALLDLVGLTDKADHYPSQLSGGQKQRVAIARALANNPSVLLCDETTSALDPETTLSILHLIHKIQRERHIAILFITHDMDVIKTISDRVIVLDQGKIIEETDVISIFKNPQTAIAQSLTQACLHCELPDEIQHSLQPHNEPTDSAIIRIKFLGHPAVEPVIDELIREHNLKINIFQANLEYIRSETIGMMIVSAQGHHADIQTALAFLNSKNCQTDILGYQ